MLVHVYTSIDVFILIQTDQIKIDMPKEGA